MCLINVIPLKLHTNCEKEMLFTHIPPVYREEKEIKGVD